jgi:geranylgeranylglycerol-phosphate geranylgeranyltransferase
LGIETKTVVFFTESHQSVIIWQLWKRMKFMRRIIAMYKLARPTTSLSGAMAVILGGYVAGTGEWLNIILAAVATFLATGAANAWNDYLDIEIDRINQPQRVLPAGLMSLRGAWIFSIGLTLIALLIAAFINLPSFLVALVATVILYIYSWKLKSTVLMGNATIATISALSAILAVSPLEMSGLLSCWRLSSRPPSWDGKC